PIVGDRIGGHDELARATHEHVLALLRRGLDEIDVGVAELLGHVAGDVDVEALVLVAVLQTEAGLVVLDADVDGAFAAATVATAAGRCGAAGVAGSQAGGQRERGRDREQSETLDHWSAPCVWWLSVRVVVVLVCGGCQCVRILPRKSLARSDFGLVKNSSGSASSTIWPSDMNTTRLAALRA